MDCYDLANGTFTTSWRTCLRVTRIGGEVTREEVTVKKVEDYTTQTYTLALSLCVCEGWIIFAPYAGIIELMANTRRASLIRTLVVRNLMVSSS